MRLDRIELEDFRSYGRAAFEFSPGVNVITGPNARGKTNLLESIYILTGARSFRARSDRELIRFGAESALVRAELFSRGRMQRIELLLRRGCSRRSRRNGAAVRSAELAETASAVLFCPDDLDIVRAGAAERRKFLDGAVCQLRPKYAGLLSRYSRLLDQKGAALRGGAEKPSLLLPLAEYSDAMAALSAQLIRYRAAFVRRLEERAREIHADFSGCGEELSLRYVTVSTVTDPLAPAQEIYAQVLSHQRAHERAELESRSCLTGVHKDELEIMINGVPARQFASQGQARTAALSLKMAERLIFLDDMGEAPLLLLDDVLSELDARRQEFVLNSIGGGQTFITCCEDAGIASRTGGRVITI